MTTRTSLQGAALLIMLGLAACGGSGPAETLTNELPTEEEGPVSDAFRFIGKAPGAGPGAKVTIHVGDTHALAETDSRETFQVDVPLASLEDGKTVRIHVRGSGSREHIEWHVAAPDAARLRERAGQDRILTPDEYIDLELSEVAVGRYARLFSENGKQHITSREQFERLQRDLVDGNDVLASGAIKWLVSNGGAALPAGYETTWDWLQDETVFDVAEGGVDAKRRGRRAKATASDDGQFVAFVPHVLEDFEPFAADDVPASYLLTEISRSVLDLKGGLLRFNEDGTGEHVTPAGTNAMTWRINELGELVVTPQPGKLMSLVTLKELLINTANQATRTQEFVGDIVLRRLRSGEYADLLTMQYRIEEREIGDDSGFWPQTGIFHKAVTAIRPDSGTPFSEEELSGRTWAMPGLALGVTQTMERAAQQLVPGFVKVRDEGLVTFHEDGTGLLHDGDLEFDWFLDDDGNLELVFADETVVTYRKMRQDGPAYDLAVMQTDPETGEQFVNGGLAVIVDESAAFEIDAPVRLVRFGDVASRFDLQGLRPFVVELFDDATAKWPPPNGVTIGNERDKKWYLDGRNLVVESIRRYINDGDGHHFDPTCDPDSDDCLVMARRTLVPLHRDGARIYTLDTEIQYWFAAKNHELYGEPATVRRTISYWEAEALATEE